jgi:hypothetical protein
LGPPLPPAAQARIADLPIPRLQIADARLRPRRGITDSCVFESAMPRMRIADAVPGLE